MQVLILQSFRPIQSEELLLQKLLFRVSLLLTFSPQQTGHQKGPSNGFIIDLKPIPALGLGERFCHRTKLQTNMLILRLSLPKCNTRMAQGMQWSHAIRNYTRKVKLRYQHVPNPFCNPPNLLCIVFLLLIQVSSSLVLEGLYYLQSANWGLCALVHIV